MKLKLTLSLVAALVWLVAINGQINPSQNCCAQLSNGNKLLELTTQLLQAKVKNLETKNAALETKLTELTKWTKEHVNGKTFQR